MGPHHHRLDRTTAAGPLDQHPLVEPLPLRRRRRRVPQQSSHYNVSAG